MLFQTKLGVTCVYSRTDIAESDTSRAEIYSVNNALRNLEQETFRRFLLEKQAGVTTRHDIALESDSDNSCIDVTGKEGPSFSAISSRRRIRSKSVDSSKRLKEKKRFGGV